MILTFILFVDPAVQESEMELQTSLEDKNQNIVDHNVTVCRVLTTYLIYCFYQTIGHVNLLSVIRTY